MGNGEGPVLLEKEARRDPDGSRDQPRRGVRGGPLTCRDRCRMRARGTPGGDSAHIPTVLVGARVVASHSRAYLLGTLTVCG